jgi:hypothetical protein
MHWLLWLQLGICEELFLSSLLGPYSLHKPFHCVSLTEQPEVALAFNYHPEPDVMCVTRKSKDGS